MGVISEIISVHLSSLGKLQLDQKLSEILEAESSNEKNDIPIFDRVWSILEIHIGTILKDSLKTHIGTILKDSSSIR